MEVNYPSFRQCNFRGFAPNRNSKIFLVIHHRRVYGAWVYGGYIYDPICDEHYIVNLGGKHLVYTDTVGMQDPATKMWPGDTCFHQRIRGVVRFGRHADHSTAGREEGGYYIEWLGGYKESEEWSTDLADWLNKPTLGIVWTCTYWDPVSEYRHLI